MPKQFGLSKKERLKSRKQIEGLFANGKSFTCFPIRVSYQLAAANDPLLQIGVTASKRYFKKAVDRNRIKRLLREAYRLQKAALLVQLNTSQKSGAVFFIYTDKSIAPLPTIKEAMAKCLKRLSSIAANESTK